MSAFQFSVRLFTVSNEIFVTHKMPTIIRISALALYCYIPQNLEKVIFLMAFNRDGGLYSEGGGGGIFGGSPATCPRLSKKCALV